MMSLEMMNNIYLLNCRDHDDPRAECSMIDTWSRTLVKAQVKDKPKFEVRGGKSTTELGIMKVLMLKSDCRIQDPDAH